MADQDQAAINAAQLAELNAFFDQTDPVGFRAAVLCFWVAEPEAALRAIRGIRKALDSE